MFLFCLFLEYDKEVSGLFNYISIIFFSPYRRVAPRGRDTQDTAGEGRPTDPVWRLIKMSAAIAVMAAVEGIVDEVVVRRLLGHVSFTPGEVYGKNGASLASFRKSSGSPPGCLPEMTVPGELPRAL